MGLMLLEHRPGAVGSFQLLALSSFRFLLKSGILIDDVHATSEVHVQEPCEAPEILGCGRVCYKL